jgi:hypothetical protein
LHTIRAIIRDGKIQLLEDIELPEGTEILVTPLIEDQEFCLKAGEPSLDRIRDQSEDKVYAELLIW